VGQKNLAPPYYCLHLSRALFSLSVYCQEGSHFPDNTQGHQKDAYSPLSVVSTMSKFIAETARSNLEILSASVN